MSAQKQYFVNLVLAGSRFVSAILLGHPDDSISQRTARAWILSSVHSTRWKLLNLQMLLIDKVFELLLGEENHCLNSLHGESVAKELWSWSGKERERYQPSAFD